MSYSHRPSSLYASSTSTAQFNALQNRISQKRLELENLKQLQLLSSQLATQMSALEAKLSTLRDGTEAVAEVMKNWGSVLGVLGMVGQNVGDMGDTQKQEGLNLPGTLVRVPVGAGKGVMDEADEEAGGDG